MDETPFCYCETRCIIKTITKTDPTREIKIWGCAVKEPCKFYLIIQDKKDGNEKRRRDSYDETNKKEKKSKVKPSFEKVPIKQEDNGLDALMTSVLVTPPPLLSSTPYIKPEIEAVDDDTVYCNCQTDPRTIASFRQSTKAVSEGEWFYSCPNWNTTNCKFFAWKKDLDKAKTNPNRPISKENLYHVTVLNSKDHPCLNSCPPLSPYTLDEVSENTKLYKILRNAQTAYCNKKDLCFYLFRDLCIKLGYNIKDASKYAKIYEYYDLRISLDQYFDNELTIYVIPLCLYEKPKPSHPDDFVLPVQMTGPSPEQFGWLFRSIATHFAFETPEHFIIVQRSLLHRYISENVVEKVNDLSDALNRCYEPNFGKSCDVNETIVFISLNQIKTWMPQGVSKPIVTDCLNIPEDLATVYQAKLNPIQGGSLEMASPVSSNIKSEEKK